MTDKLKLQYFYFKELFYLRFNFLLLPVKEKLNLFTPPLIKSKEWQILLTIQLLDNTFQHILPLF